MLKPQSETAPAAHRGDEVDIYHGVTVPDPYRWLEDVDSPETGAWIEAERGHTDRFLATIPERETIRRRMTEIWNYERFGIPGRVGPRYAYTKNSGLQNQSVVYVAPALDGPERVLIDPNGFSEDGTVALSGLSFSDDGRLAAYATSASGSDWMTWRVRDVESGSDLADEIAWSKFSGASWLPDGSGFYYCRYDAPVDATQFKDENYFHKLYFHRIGTVQADDALIYERPDHKDWNFGPAVSEDGRWLVIHVSQGSNPNNQVFVRDLHDPTSATIEMLPDDAAYGFLGNDGERFYFQTTKDAQRGRVVAMELRAPVVVEIVAQADDALEDASVSGDLLILSYLHDAHAVVRRYDLQGRPLGEVTLPGLGSVGGLGGRRRENERFFSFTGYTTPASIYRLDAASGSCTRVFAPQVHFDPAAFVTEQVFYASKDGTRIPMFVTTRRGTPRDGTTPMILYGYGGFSISMTPGFSPPIIAWLELGGAFAVANIRGGAEYGEAWHLAGTKLVKQNVFDDFIAAAEYLIAQGYTSTPKLAISGGSNGGLLVGACLTQRPDLFGAAVPTVGVFDMLRFQKFTIGWAWMSDYGSSDDPDEFRALRAYSPLHNLRPGTAYPATLIVTADHDDRVFPAHSFKFAAALQAVQGGPAPVLIRIETKAGHGAGKPTAKVIDEAADRYGFLIRVLGVSERS